MALLCLGPFDDASAPIDTCSGVWLVHGANLVSGLGAALLQLLVALDLTIITMTDAETSGGRSRTSSRSGRSARGTNSRNPSRSGVVSMT